MELDEMVRLETDGVIDRIKEMSDELSAEILTYENVNSEAALQEIKNLKPDLIISIRFGQIFQQPLINIPKFGVINLHSGLLPSYRGVLATFWEILHGEKKIGTTLHYITDYGIDTGNIISFSYEEINYESSLLQNINNLYQAGCTNIVRCLEKIEKGEKIDVVVQNTLGKSGYFSYPRGADVLKFLEIMPLV